MSLHGSGYNARFPHFRRSERKNGVYTTIGTFEAGETSYIDTDVDPDGYYYYKIFRIVGGETNERCGSDSVYVSVNGTVASLIPSADTFHIDMSALSRTYDGKRVEAVVTPDPDYRADYEVFYQKVKDSDGNDVTEELAAVAPIDAGEYQVVIKGDEYAEYKAATLSPKEWRFVITKRDFTITAKSYSVVYDTRFSPGERGKWEYTYSGNLENETPGLSGDLICDQITPPYVIEATPGVYTVGQGTLIVTSTDTFDINNYDVKFVPGTVTVTSKKANESNGTNDPLTEETSDTGGNGTITSSTSDSTEVSSSTYVLPNTSPSATVTPSPVTSPATVSVTPASAPAKKGSIIKDAASGGIYTVTSSASTSKKRLTVTYQKPANAKKTVSIPKAITYNGFTYKVTAIAANAFKDNAKLSKVTIADNVAKIGKNTFAGCTKLKSLVIKTKLLTEKNVGKNAFKGVNSKVKVTCPRAKKKAYATLLKKRGVK